MRRCRSAARAASSANKRPSPSRSLGHNARVNLGELRRSRAGGLIAAGNRAFRARVDGRSDERFLVHAYSTVLKRAPDADGTAFYLRRLREGMRREDVLMALALSEESIDRVLRDRPGANAARAFQLDYPVVPRPRSGWGTPPHEDVRRLLDQGRDRYRSWLDAVAPVTDQLAAIPAVAPPGAIDPAWENGWIPALDAVALYAFLVRLNPSRYVEIGSGNSTRFARRAIGDHRLRSSITSIDPTPRAEIDAIVDTAVRRPLEDADLELFAQLQADDVLFFDGSHRALTNSDATVMFTEILPRLQPGVVVQVHDIWLPDDYPAEQAERLYSEQYLLTVMLLAGGMGYEVILPCWYVTHDAELSSVLAPLWERIAFSRLETHGCSFWMRRREMLPA